MSGNPRWKGMAWGMMPCLGSAMCACTWHLFYNSPDLEVSTEGLPAGTAAQADSVLVQRPGKRWRRGSKGAGSAP